jgi:drug/metabolite transporter (DMT)-like permease
MRKPLLACLLAAALFGAATPAAKVLLGGLGPLTLAGLLYLGAALATVPWALRGWAAFRHLDSRTLLRLGGAVLFGGVVAPVALLRGLSGAPAASVALWLNLEPVATTALAWALFREHVQRRTWLAAGLVCAAGVVLAAPSGFGLGAAGAWVGLACLCWGLDNNFTALIDRLTPAQTTFVKGAVAGAFNLGLGLALERHDAALGTVLGAGAVGLVSYGASLVLYIGAAQQLGASRSQLVFASAPFWGVLIAWGVLREPPSAVQGLAGALMLLALALLHGERHAHAHWHEPTVHTHAHRHDDGHHDHVHPGLPAGTWHSHEHAHGTLLHEHPHQPDLHHRHTH